jgi:pyruvate formate lyase activating enzyme
MDAIILDIQRMSTEDGPGLRTTVFFKGCNLSCAWCHNPESIGRKPDLNWLANKCIGCGICVTACGQQGISRNEGTVRFRREDCVACRNCETECPNGAIELKGRPIEVDQLCNELAKDSAYFGLEGGITLSGGEVMLQWEAAGALAKLLKERGLHIAVDTAGCYDYKALEAVLPYIDLTLYDIKIFDPQAHKRFTGADNRIILENYRKLVSAGTRLWVRTPIIEGATDSEENIRAIGAFLREAGLPGTSAERTVVSEGVLEASLRDSPPEKWELCTFNNLCRDKYLRLDKDWMYKDTGLTKKQHIERLTAIAGEYADRAVWSGSTKD